MDETASERAKLVKPSDRGELEITSLLTSYQNDNTLDIQLLDEVVHGLILELIHLYSKRRVILKP